MGCGAAWYAARDWQSRRLAANRPDNGYEMRRAAHAVGCGAGEEIGAAGGDSA